jgi:hypothetical protein
MTDEQQHSDLVIRAWESARALRRTARLVEYAAVLAIALTIIYLVAGVYGWSGFIAVTLTVVVSLLLVGRMARARSVTLELAAAQFELTRAAHGEDAPEAVGSEPD